MKNTKKFLALLLAMVLAAALAACGDSGQAAQESGNISKASESQAVSEPEAVKSETATPEPESQAVNATESEAEPESQEEVQGGEEASQATTEASLEEEIGGAGESPSTDIPKETAYTSGNTLVTGEDDESIYDLEFVDGVLSAAYYEDDEGKGGWGGDSGVPIEDCRFYGMTVEEVAEELASMNYRVEIH